MNDDEKRDRRTAERVPVSCRCWLSRDSVTVFGEVTNLSRGGLHLRAPHLLAEGSAIDLSLKLGSDVVVAEGRVVWAREAGGSAERTGMGIRFDELKAGRDLLGKYIDRRLEEQR